MPDRSDASAERITALLGENDCVITTGGVSVGDQYKCIGCGLCTTRCEFDAIHLQRDMPEASRMYRTEDKMKAILPHMVKRAAKLTIKDIKGKRAK